MSELSLPLVLRDFGLTDPEIAIYLASLAHGAQPASVIAKKAGLKRGHAYNMLSALMQKGLVQEFLQEGIRFFSSRPPASLLTDVEHREDRLKLLKQKLLRVAPLLERMKNPLLVQPKVRFFQGIEGIREIYEDTIRIHNQPIYALGDFEYFFPEQHHKELYDWIWKYADRRAKKGIWYIGIANKSEKSDKAYLLRTRQKRKLKMLTDVYLPVEINIYGNKVAVISTYRDMVGVIIEDEPIAETLRNFHRAVWKFLPDYRVSTRT